MQVPFDYGNHKGMGGSCKLVCKHTLHSEHRLACFSPARTNLQAPWKAGSLLDSPCKHSHLLLAAQRHRQYVQMLPLQACCTAPEMRVAGITKAGTSTGIVMHLDVVHQALVVRRI